MPCRETYPNVCSRETAAVCGSSYSASAIAANVRINSPCTSNTP
ncbi:hypothetical protein [Bacillus canaveralius]|nr:hypothetical protein [Bacillus canaveralius]